MRKKKLYSLLYPAFIIITITSIIAITWYSTSAFRGFFYEQVADDLLKRALLIENVVSHEMANTTPHALDELVMKLGKRASMRITIISPSGKVLADSNEDPAHMENHINRPEVREALSDGHGFSTRYSSTILEKMMYVAIELQSDGQQPGILRTSVSLQSIDKALAEIRLKIILSSFLIAVVIAFISHFLSRRIVLPLERIRMGAKTLCPGRSPFSPSAFQL